MARKKKHIQLFPYGSLYNAAVRLNAPREWYVEKRNGDIVMKVKVGVSTRIRVRPVE